MGFKLSQIDDNIARLDLMGTFDAEDAQEYLEQVAPYFERVIALDKKLHIFIDSTQFEKLSTEGRRVFSDLNKHPAIGNLATMGINRIYSMLARFIMIASGKNNIRFFNSEDEALTWLREAK